MDISAYWVIVRRRGWIVVVAAITSVIVAAMGTKLLMTPLYSASATVRLRTPVTGSTDYVTYDTVLADRLAVTYEHLLRSEKTQQELKDKLGRSPGFVVQLLAGSELITVTAEDPDPEVAAEAANLLGDLLVAQIQEQDQTYAASAEAALVAKVNQTQDELNQLSADYDRLVARDNVDPDVVAAAKSAVDAKNQTVQALSSQLDRLRATDVLQTASVSVAEYATSPSSPSSPHTAFNIALGLFAGVVAGAGLVFLFEHLDTRIHNTQDIQNLVAKPILGRIPTANRRSAKSFPLPRPAGFSDRQTDGRGRWAPPDVADAQFDWLRAELIGRGKEESPRVIAVTSATPGEGKTTIVVGLAAAVARSGRSVLAIDGNLRQPHLHEVLAVSRDVGLTSIFTRQESPRLAIQETTIPGFSVIPSGTPHQNALAEFGSRALDSFFERLRSQYDLVLVDTPALIGAADAAELVRHADATLVVVARGRIQPDSLRLALEHLDAIGATVVGIVVNHSEEAPRFSRPRRLPRSRSKRTPPGLESSATRTRQVSVTPHGSSSKLTLHHQPPVSSFTSHQLPPESLLGASTKFVARRVVRSAPPEGAENEQRGSFSPETAPQ